MVEMLINCKNNIEGILKIVIREHGWWVKKDDWFIGCDLLLLELV